MRPVKAIQKRGKLTICLFFFENWSFQSVFYFFLVNTISSKLFKNFIRYILFIYSGKWRNRGTARGSGARGRRGRARVNHARGRDANQPPINWSSTYQAPEPPAFNEPHPGPTSTFQDVQEKDYFEHLFNNEMWEIIVSETNRYYEQQKASDPDHHKTEWHPVTKGEVHAFVGMLILMGIVRPARFQM